MPAVRAEGAEQEVEPGAAGGSQARVTLQVMLKASIFQRFGTVVNKLKSRRASGAGHDVLSAGTQGRGQDRCQGQCRGVHGVACSAVS